MSKPTKKALTGLLDVAIEAVADANPEFDPIDQGEALTLVRIELKRLLPTLVAKATGATIEQATDAIAKATTTLETKANAKKD